MKLNKILNIVIILLILCLIAVFSGEWKKRADEAQIKRQAEIEASKDIIATDENSIVLTDAIDNFLNSDEETALTYDNFKVSSKRTSYHVGETSISYRFARELISGGKDIYVLNFKMRACEHSAQLNVKFGIEHVYNLTSEWREFFVPCAKGTIDSIKLSLPGDYQRTELCDLRVIRYDPLLVDLYSMKNGSYLVDGMPEFYFGENDGIGVGGSMDIVGDGKYVYSAGKEQLVISEISNNTTKKVSVLEGIGNIRHMELKDDNLLGIAGRETGVYLVNIADKTNPYIESYYDPLEIANDICFSGNYMFTATRYFGVEIVDISDIRKPKFITKIENGKECFRCSIAGKYLFVSCWSTGEVEIYDVSKINEPILVSVVSTEGRCGEAVTVGENLFVVSGYSNFVNADELGDAGYATGNGLAIYNISDIERPRLSSTIKTEGVLLGNGYDDWSVRVAGNYVYFTNSFGGIYIYDITDTYNPIAVGHVGVKILPDSENFSDFSKISRTVYPYNVKEYILSPAMGLYVYDGCVFIACANSDVYKYDFDKAEAFSRTDTAFEFAFSDKTEKASEEYEVFLKDFDVYAIVKYRDGYVAAANEGLMLLDASLNLVNIYYTDTPVKDIKAASENVFVTAEKDGVGLYKIENGTIDKTGYVKSKAENHSVSSIGVTGDGKFVIAQSSWTGIEAINIVDRYNPFILDNIIGKYGESAEVNLSAKPGNMYYRNIVSGNPGGMVGIGGGGGNMVWFESRGGVLRIANKYQNYFASETNGSAAVGSENEILSVYNNGYVIYDPTKATDESIRKLTRYYIPNVRLKGKASVNGNIMALCNQPTGEIHIVNISDISNPYREKYVKADGCPNIALVEDNFVLVPIRHGGIIKIKFD